MSDIPSPVLPAPGPTQSDPEGVTGSPLDAVLRILTAAGRVTQKMRHSAQAALSAVPRTETIVDAYGCGLLNGASEREGVAVLTTERLSVFERRGFRSPDQRFQLSLAAPFSVEAGPGATHVTLIPAGARPTTLDLLDVSRAAALRDELAALRSAREEGWWSQASVVWPGWLGAIPSWSYLGGDPRLPGPAHGLKVQVGRSGLTIGDVDGSITPLAPWPAVSHLHVIGPEKGFQRAAALGLLASESFGAAWRSAEWSAFIVVGYATGNQVFLGTTSLSEADLRARLFRVAQAMPSAHPPLPEGSGPAPADAGAEAQGTDHDATAVDASGPDAAGPGDGTSVADRAAPFDLAAQLERLAVLHRQGVLDDAEFVRAKAALLGG
ncbi:MAG: hypothetical protein ACRD0O_19250 [Acidimicrobiia bacterium]